MDTEKFKATYSESRNGANQLFRHPMSRRFVYSDGVQECAQAGCYWLLDVLATEAIAHMKKHPFEHMMIVKVLVRNEGAKICGSLVDDDPKPWRRSIDYTDLPDGEWTFYLTWDGDHYTLILPSEY